MKQKKILSDKYGVVFQKSSKTKIILEKGIIKKVGDEGYTLSINKSSIVIKANTDKGLFYGLQSLKQLLKEPSVKNYLPGCEITDWPDYKTRAISDDISRGPIPTLEYMKMQIRRLAELKVNSIVHYVEHVVKNEKSS